MPTFNKIRFFSEALDLLNDRGIDWTHTRRGTTKEVNRYSGGSVTEPSVHIYFMNAQDQDVAYYTPIVGTVVIHDTPRTWSKETLAAEPITGKKNEYPPRPH